MNSIPAFYFPSTIICVDDDLLVHESYKALFSKYFRCIFFSNAQQALNYFTQYKTQINISDFISSMSEYESENSLFQSAIELQISKITDLVMNEHKHNEVSLLLADYYMPDMNGIQLCEKLSAQPCQKILLTGTEDYLTVLQAQNKHIINHFTQKSKSAEAIREDIYNMSIKYFCNITSNINQHLAINGYSPTIDAAFIEYFMKIVLQHGITAFFLLDKNGSFLLYDQFNKKYALIVHNAKSISEFISVIEDEINMEDVISSLTNMDKIPFLGLHKTWSDINMQDITQHLYPSTTIEGKNKYYVSLLALT